VVVALMSIKEHQHATVTKVAATKALAIHAVNLGIGQDVSNTLKIDDHQIPVSDLPREVAQCLCNE
jgi:hypothetical protein